MLKNWLYQNSIGSFFKHRKLWLSVLFALIGFFIKAQVNFVPNPSFESYTTCPTTQLGQNFVKNWKSLDSINFTNCFFEYYHACAGVIPNGPRYTQYPRTGKGFVLLTMYCVSVGCAWERSHMRVKLKQPLILGKTYCAKMYVNLGEQCYYAVDDFAMYFDNGILDTVQKCGRTIDFVTPQVKNPLGNVINDTINWVEVSGTFVATGNESYLTIGNFLNNSQTSLFAFNPTFPALGSVYLIDDVSVIDYNLPANAGSNQTFNLGDSAFIGQPTEIGLECTWTSGTVAIGSGGGLWVKPGAVGSYSYVVTQNICGNIKKDTVFVTVNPSGTGVTEQQLFSQSISIYPQPAKDLVNISLSYFYEESVSVLIMDINSKEILNKELPVDQNKTTLNTSEFSNGVYFLQIKNRNGQTAVKKLVIAK